MWKDMKWPGQKLLVLLEKKGGWKTAFTRMASKSFFPTTSIILSNHQSLKTVMFPCERFITFPNKAVHRGGNCSLDRLTSSAVVCRSIENLSFSSVRTNSVATSAGWAIFKNSPKQRSRLQGAELDNAVSSILSGLPEVADIRAVAAWGQQTFKESLRMLEVLDRSVALALFVLLIPLSLHTFPFSWMRTDFTNKLDEPALKNSTRLNASPTGLFIQHTQRKRSAL